VVDPALVAVVVEDPGVEGRGLLVGEAVEAHAVEVAEGGELVAVEPGGAGVVEVVPGPCPPGGEWPVGSPGRRRVDPAELAGAPEAIGVMPRPRSHSIRPGRQSKGLRWSWVSMAEMASLCPTSDRRKVRVSGVRRRIWVSVGATGFGDCRIGPRRELTVQRWTQEHVASMQYATALRVMSIEPRLSHRPNCQLRTLRSSPGMRQSRGLLTLRPSPIVVLATRDLL
jgi:hypothetical protein